MTSDQSTARGIIVAFTRPTDFQREAAWDEWERTEHLPAMVERSAATVASRWEADNRPPGFSAVQGFTHVTIYEYPEPDAGASRFRDAFREVRRGGELHPDHAIVAVDAFRGVGRWGEKPDRSERLKGQVLTYTMVNDPTCEQEWHTWYDDVHVPDMMGSGAFAATTRWERLDPRPFSTNFLTLYDIETEPIDEAVAKSAAVMPGLSTSGRLYGRHFGGMRVTLRPPSGGAWCGYRRHG